MRLRNTALKKFKFRALQKIGLYFYYVEYTVEMQECRNTGKKVSPASLVLPLVCCVSPASAFRHRPQSGTAGHGFIR
jgi:hypothetical protein